ncbi:uncharacterized protein LOC112502535 [Cynara cardunculus var. scolymus]|uniref:uncharacterized protein LOC112502535 n=1 Tax=Cynara cardunculus var. scolymus TaxID=59895 RepID=UPI000D628B64|nr:uncharacterized protein LOC112502535 [Cynara cardunculus var. scolymus]
MGDNPPPQEAIVNIADDKNGGIRDYTTPEFGQLASGIGRPEMTATSFEPKPVMFQMIFAMGQFGGLSSEDPAAKIILDATAGGAFTAKTYNEGYDILERISNNNTEWSNPRAVISKSASGIHELDAISSLNAQIVALTNLVKNNLNSNGKKNQVQSIMSNSSMIESCVFCGESHSYEFCPESPVSVNYVGNHTRNSPFSLTYNPNWRNHPNFSWARNPGLQPPGATQVQNRPSNPPGFHQGGHQMQGNHQMYQSGQSSQSHAPRQQNASKGNGSLESLLKGFINQTNATLRNFETQLGQFAADLKNRPQGTLPSDTETPKEHVKAVTLRSDKNFGDSNAEKETPTEPICQENISHSFDTSKFPVMFPTAEETQIPVSVSETAALPRSSTTQSPSDTAHCGQKLPTPQQKKIGPTDLDMRDLPFPSRMKAKNVDVQFKKFLDIFKQLHINILLVEALEKMPSYLGIGEVRPTTVTLQLGDRSLAYTKGRPFLATGRTLIDVQKGELTMRVNDQQVTFNVFKTLKFNGEIEDCSSIYSVGEDLDLSLIDCVHSGDTVGMA